MKLLPLAICAVAIQICSAGNASPIQVPLDYQGGWTLATINVGTPPSEYRVGVTINDILGAMMSQNLASLEFKKSYDSSQSSSSNLTKFGCAVNLDFGEQQTGNIVVDKLTLNGVVLDNYAFCNTNGSAIYYYNYSSVPADGSLSLGRIYTDNYIMTVLPLMQNFKDSRFTLYYNQLAKNYDTLQKNAGFLTLGGLDTKNCGFFHFFDGLDEGFWSLKADVVKFNQKVYYPDSSSEGRVRFYTFSFESDNICLPDDAVQAIRDYFYMQDNSKIVNCDRAKNAPKITIRLNQGSVEYDILPKDYVEELTPGNCELRVQKITSFGDDSFAYPASISLGAPFLRAYCVAFDITNNQIGLAPVLS